MTLNEEKGFFSNPNPNHYPNLLTQTFQLILSRQQRGRILCLPENSLTDEIMEVIIYSRLLIEHQESK